eukprot:COSAG01_NODE_34905_length_540_cov_1.000000_1_plen_64_part_10
MPRGRGREWLELQLTTPEAQPGSATEAGAGAGGAVDDGGGAAARLVSFVGLRIPPLPVRAPPPR